MIVRQNRPWQRTQAARRVRSADQAWAERIIESIIASCHPWQRDALLDLSRWITLLVGRGGGKTTTMMLRAICTAVSVAKAKIVYCAASRPMAEELVWEPLKEALERLGLVPGRDVLYHEGKLRCTILRTGATIRLVGIDDTGEINKLRGQPWDLVLGDEASIYPIKLLETFVHKVIEPRLGDRFGTIILGGTPAHQLEGIFYDASRPSGELHRPYADRDNDEYKDWIGWSSHYWTNKDIFELPDSQRLYPRLHNLWLDALLKKRKNGWSDRNPTWLREYLGIWSSDETEQVYQFVPHDENGKEWNVWSPHGKEKLTGLLGLAAAIKALPGPVDAEGKRVPNVSYDWQYAMWMDEGYRDPFAIAVLAFAPDDPERRILEVFEFEKRQCRTRQVAELVLGPQLNADDPDGIYGEIGWPVVAGIDSNERLQTDLANDYSIRLTRNERKQDSKHAIIETVNGALIDGRLKAIAGGLLATQMSQLQWVEDKHGFLRENKKQANHLTDCTAYAVTGISDAYGAGMVVPPPPEDKPEEAEAESATEPVGYDELGSGGGYDSLYGGYDAFG